MITLSSKKLVERIHARTSAEVAMCMARGIEPQLAVVLVGDDANSHTYVGIKEKRAKEVGITFSSYFLPNDTPTEQLAETVSFLSDDPEVSGVIVQLPLIQPHDTQHIISLIDSRKDVDGLGSTWVKAVSKTSPQTGDQFMSQSALVSPMAESVVSLLAEYHISLFNMKIVIVGNGRLVGQPLNAYLCALGCDVTVVTEDTAQITRITSQADILICGTGQTGLITYQWVKEGAVVIDCSRDVHTDSVSQVASAIAPSIGGVGPLTVAWLLNNTLRATVEAHG